MNQTTTPVKIKFLSSPNKAAGRESYQPEAVVLHVAQGTFKGTISWFLKKKSQVSTHYLIGRLGEVVQFVAEKDTAWHAGHVHSPTWAGIKKGVNPNLYTIGIECEGRVGEGPTELQKSALIKLLAAVCARWAIPLSPDYIVGHHEINARKKDPGVGYETGYIARLAHTEAKLNQVIY